mgnify:CR=1 FL=1
MKYSYLVLIALCFAGGLAGAQPSADAASTARYLIHLDDRMPRERFEQRSRSLGLTHVRKVTRTYNMHVYEMPPLADRAALEDDLKAMPGVLGIQPDEPLQKRLTPNDPRFNQQWDMDIIGLPQAWDFTTGGVTARGDTLVVAVLDTGFDFAHDDLQDNLFVNIHEIPEDGLDNDDNGFIDDVRGWDFDRQGPEHAYDDHGLSVSGILGARGDNATGVTGVLWKVKVLPITVKLPSQVVEAYEYLIEFRRRYNQSQGREGMFVVATNASFGIEERPCDRYPLWAAMYDELGAVGILTGAGTANKPNDVDVVGDMPTACPSPFILTTLNTNQLDRKYFNSAFGQTTIDMGAPGEGTFTLRPENNYGTFGGNSAAAPHLTGAIALLYSIPCENFAQQALDQPEETALRVREALLLGVDPIPDLAEFTITGGRLNVFNSMVRLLDECDIEIGALKLERIYPNPYFPRSYSGPLIIDFQAPSPGPYRLLITNMLGQRFFDEQITLDPFLQNQVELDAQNLPHGMYVVRIEQGNLRFEGKFLVHWY